MNYSLFEREFEMEEKKIEQPLISVNAAVHIQGEQVLEFIALDQEQVEFNLVGLTEPRIHVVDRRLKVREAMQRILEDKKVEMLADEFNQPAHVTVLPEMDGQVVVRLEKTRSRKPRHMLWMAIGVGDEIPYYDYKQLIVQPLVNQTIALFSLYKRPAAL